MKVLLATSPHTKHATVLQNDFTVQQRAMYSFVPLGLLSLIAAARDNSPENPELVDLNEQINNGTVQLGRSFYGHAADMFCAAEPDVLGFMTECDSYHHVLQILQAVHERRPQCKLILGGPHATATARETMERVPFVDAIVMGEGETSFPELLKSYAAEDETPIRGVIRRRLCSSVQVGGQPVPLMQNLDELPIPAYELYRPALGEEIFLEVGRGCPFRCTFCSTAPFWRRQHRVKSPQRIIAEIKFVFQLYGTRRFHFTHDLLTVDRHWVMALCKTFADCGLNVNWTCSARTDTVDDELLSTMARAGCSAIYFGLESGSQRILKDIDKDIPLSVSLQAIESCAKTGITANAGVIVGFPNDDANSLDETFAAFEKLLRAGCRPAHIFGFCPFAQSTIYKDLRNLTCTGHFLDLPIHPDVDDANRRLISSDSTLYGSYFRPSNQVRQLLEGADEFSCLVDATKLPSLYIAEEVGSMFELYKRWIAWIDRHNTERGSQYWRRFYGTPVLFCDFLTSQLNRNSRLPYMSDLLRVLRENLSIPTALIDVPTSMAGYRSLQGGHLDWDTLLVSSNIVRLLRLDWDVSGLMKGIAEDNCTVEQRPTFLVWQLTPEKSVRLVKVNSLVFMALQQLREKPCTASQLLPSWIDSPDVSFIASTTDPLRELAQAHELGLIGVASHAD